MYFFRDSSAKQLPAFKDPCFELAMARRKEEARWGWIPFAIFVFFLLVYRFFGLVMPSNNADGSQSWLFLLVLAGWGLLGLVHMVVIPIWMLIASLHYWAAVQPFGSCQHGFHAVLLVHVWIKVHFPS